MSQITSSCLNAAVDLRNCVCHVTHPPQVPEALRPAIEDLDFFANGGQVGGFEPPLPPSAI